MLVDSQGNIYVTPGTDVVALNPDGTLRWSYKYRRYLSSLITAPTMDRNGYLYVVDETDNRLLSLDYSGQLRWARPLSGPINLSVPLVCDNAGTVYCVIVGQQPYVVAISSSGEVMWKKSFPAGGGKFAVREPAISSNRRLYVVANFHEQLINSIR